MNLKTKLQLIEEEVNPSSEVDIDPKVKTTRSGSVSRPPTKLTMAQHHVHTQAHSQEEYTTENAKLIAMTISYINEMSFNKKTIYFVQSYSLTKGVKKFGQKRREAAYIEMKQLHNRVVFETIKVEDLTELEKRREMEIKIETRVLKAGLVPMEFLDKNLWKEKRHLVPPP